MSSDVRGVGFLGSGCRGGCESCSRTVLSARECKSERYLELRDVLLHFEDGRFGIGLVGVWNQSGDCRPGAVLERESRGVKGGPDLPLM